MPIYEYRCGACEHDFEELILSASRETLPPCPKCGAADVHKKMSCFAGVTGLSSPGSGAASPPSCGFS